MRLRKVEMNVSALADIDSLSGWLSGRMSPEGARKYLDAMINEILSLAVFADLYRTSRYSDIRAIHPEARHMVSHNKKWTYIFHIEDDVVVVDRIRPAKLIKK